MGVGLNVLETKLAVLLHHLVDELVQAVRPLHPKKPVSGFSAVIKCHRKQYSRLFQHFSHHYQSCTFSSPVHFIDKLQI